MMIRKALEFVRFIRDLGPEARPVYVQMNLQLAVYWMWCKLTRKEFMYSPYTGLSESLPAEFVVEKGIPGIGVTIFGRTFWITRAMALKYKQLNERSE